MRTSQTQAHPRHESSRDIPKLTVNAERVYQGLTIAFMLMLLASLWLFR